MAKLLPLERLKLHEHVPRHLAGTVTGALSMHPYQKEHMLLIMKTGCALQLQSVITVFISRNTWHTWDYR